MKVYFGCKGKEYYILCTDFKECYAFDMFGNLINSKAGIGSCNNWVEVDFLSFVSDGSNKSEMLLNDEKTVIDVPLVDCVMVVRSIGNFLGTSFTIPHKDEEGSYTQVCFVAHKGIFTKAMLESKFFVKGWNSLL